jgi:dTDP-4-dehydrorhamnose 3,5-epimerase
MRFDITDTPIGGVKVVTRKPIGDERGWFERLFAIEHMVDLGWPSDGIVHVNHTFTADKGTVRGMHYQKPPHAEYKFVSCISGEIYDAVVDLRAGSPTFLQSFGVRLSAENHKSLMLPHGVAHGFQSLSDDAVIMYLVSTAYNFDHEGVVNPKDPRIGIAWPVNITTLSDKDGGAPFLDAGYKGLKL